MCFIHKAFQEQDFRRVAFWCGHVGGGNVFLVCQQGGPHITSNAMTPIGTFRTTDATAQQAESTR